MDATLMDFIIPYDSVGHIFNLFFSWHVLASGARESTSPGRSFSPTEFCCGEGAFLLTQPSLNNRKKNIFLPRGPISPVNWTPKQADMGLEMALLHYLFLPFKFCLLPFS